MIAAARAAGTLAICETLLRNRATGVAITGGQILFGTDVGYLPDFDPTAEYEFMSAAGLSWREILAALTANPAKRFGEDASRGRVIYEARAVRK